MKKGLAALKWNYLGAMVRSFSQLIVGVILARILGPEPFGLIAIASLVIGLGNMLSDLGFGSALIQRKELLERDLQAVFTYQVAIGAILSLLGFFVAEYVALFFHRIDAKNIIQAMASLFFIQALGQTSVAVLRRALDYKKLQRINIASYMVGYVLIGLPAAWSGWGVWSLVIAQLSQTFLNTVGLLYSAAVPMRPTLKAPDHGILGFGFKVVGANITSYLLLSLDGWIVGRVLGVTNLGIYNQARTLVASPVNIIVTGIQSVLLSTCSRIQTDKQKIISAYTGATALVALVSLPIFVTIALVSKTVINGLYGDKWTQAIPIVMPLSLAMSVHALLSIVGPILMALNKVKLEIKAQIITLLIMMPILYIGSSYSLAAVGWSIFCIYILRWLLLSHYILKELQCSWLVMIRVLGWPTLISLTTALPTFIVDSFIYQTKIQEQIQLAIVIATAVLSLLISLRYLARNILSAILGELILSSNLLPMSFRRFIKM